VSFLLDTDICSAHLKANRSVYAKFLQHAGQLHISTVTAAELFAWVLRRKTTPVRLHGLRDLLADVTILDVTIAVSEKFGEIQANLLDTGHRMPELDLLIASTALVHDLTLVTHNVRDYQHVAGLRLQDWLGP
jgi:tRNA(fMet)-specific endonuclease VapC